MKIYLFSDGFKLRRLSANNKSAIIAESQINPGRCLPNFIFKREEAFSLIAIDKFALIEREEGEIEKISQCASDIDDSDPSGLFAFHQRTLVASPFVSHLF